MRLGICLQQSLHKQSLCIRILDEELAHACLSESASLDLGVLIFNQCANILERAPFKNALG